MLKLILKLLMLLDLCQISVVSFRNIATRFKPPIGTHLISADPNPNPGFSEDAPYFDEIDDARGDDILLPDTNVIRGWEGFSEGS